MVTVKALDELTLADLWQVVPHDDEFWEDTKPRLRQMLKPLMQGALEEELTQLLGASRYRRVEWRRGYRNGSTSATSPPRSASSRGSSCRAPAACPRTGPSSRSIIGARPRSTS